MQDISKELYDVLDENGNKKGVQKTRKEVHEKGLWHQSVHMWLFNSQGEILFQKRAEDVDHWPGMWDISAAGHIPAGETPEESVLRELEEEIGIKVDFSELKKIKIRKSSKHVEELNYHNNEFQHVFLLRFDDDPSKLKFKDGEVEKVRFISMDELKSELRDKELSKKYVPHFEYYFYIIDAIKKELKNDL